jgi:hypothetical protein
VQNCCLSFLDAVSTEPFQCVSTDILGPFKPSKATENIYVLVFICYMTKYVELVPLQNIRATTIADALINHVIVETGNGTNFVFVRVCGISL